MTKVTEEAYELVEDGKITEDNFRDFVFVNPVHFWAALNRDFFTGTAVEAEAAAVLGERRRER